MNCAEKVIKISHKSPMGGLGEGFGTIPDALPGGSPMGAEGTGAGAAWQSWTAPSG